MPWRFLLHGKAILEELEVVDRAAAVATALRCEIIHV